MTKKHANPQTAIHQHGKHPENRPTAKSSHSTLSKMPRILHALLTASVAMCWLAHPGPAQAKGKKSQHNAAAATQTTTAKKKGVRKVTYQRSSSEETTAERDRRMHRECKGMHNAGACRGYTR